MVLHGFERSPVRLGEAAVVLGAGPIGLIALAVAKASGACPLVVTDLDAGRLEFARRFVPGAIPVKVDVGKEPVEMARVIGEAVVEAGGQIPRVVYECTGVQSSVVTASFVPRPGGEVMVIGVGKATMNDLPFMHMSMAEVSQTLQFHQNSINISLQVDLKFINRYHHSWPVAIRLLGYGVLDLKPLVTHRFPLEQAVEALTAASDRSSGSIKVHIEDGGAQGPVGKTISRL